MPPPSWITPLVARLRTTSPYVVDTALAALVLFAVSLQWLFPDEGDDRLTWQGWLLGAATAVPLVWRRRAAMTTACVVSAATPAMAVYHAPPPDVSYGGMVVLYTLAARGPAWQRRLMLAGWLAGTTLTMQHKEDALPFEYAFHLMGVLCAYGLGVLARVQRAYTAALEDRARRLERERAADTARAIARERSRIARDMHDILAHAVSLMVVQAEAGPVVVRSDPARAEAAFDAIAETGRDAMSQLRRILGVLKEDSAAHRLPQPGPEAVTALVRQVTESTGLQVRLRTTGHPRPLPPDTGVAAYRVVQEALTNTVKHAYATGATVELDWTEEALTLTVTDDGRGPTPPGDGGDRLRQGPADLGPGGQGATGRDAGPSGYGPGAQNLGGYGLIGIRERAAACGGSAYAGPGPDGGFRVVVRLPVAADREAALG
ncbi:sensor histidine kinase [Streptomyces sp. TRM68416]|uniref:sensor histidine kinase n=1 Tax=Streptomyces sp. TRM68416 TaxID=2758412 RepID=UPI0016621738|nr:sensor histidine kinase [Streptomyces sp. TRM68416]MBD0841380.1 sensor histidine kinase [Streptomyces sp. TRM68416]